MLWMLVALVVILSWMLSSGDATIASGDTSVGGDRAWITSQFAVSYVLSVVVFAFYTFFVAVLAGMAVIRDDELKVGELLHATPLTAGEYVWAKLAAVIAAFLGVLVIHLASMVMCNHLLPNSEHADIRGPLVLANYLVPALAFAFPSLVFIAGTSLAIGERFRKPLMVFVLPLVAVVSSILFLWEWSPSWLDPRLNRLLMLVDPSGFRWLNETWLKVDRGVAFYNTGQIGFDVGFVLSRLAFVGIGLGAVMWSHRHLVATLRGATRHPKLSSVTPLETPTTSGAVVSRLGELASSPGLYLFVPIILMQAFGNIVNTGAFEAPLLFTPGMAAARMANSLTLLVCLLLAFYTVESLWRDRATGMGAIVSASPVPSAAMLLGKSLANSVVGAVILIAALIACAVGVLVQGKVPFSLAPFAVLWGGLLLPTFIGWTAFVAAVFAITRSRYATYGIALSVFAVTAYFQFRDKMTWAGNWDLWGIARWTDMGALQVDRPALILNRVMILGLALLFVALAVRFHPRSEKDPSLIITRLAPPSLLRGALRLSPLLAVPLIAGCTLWVLVDRGPEGGGAERRAEEYWKQNLGTFKDAPLPDIEHVELSIAIEPSASSFSASGSYRLVNRKALPLPRFAVTSGHHWEDIQWTLDGGSYEPENRSGLFVIEPPLPLAIGQSVDLGFSYHGRLPRGVSKNGSSLSEFILPCGVVLTSFSTSVAPVLGFVEEIGVDDDNRYEPRVYPPDFWQEINEPLYGSASAFTTHITITVPETYVANSVGVLLRDEVSFGTRTFEWQSDHPVRFFNIIAGRWSERQGRQTRIFFHPGHPYNVDEMLSALDGSRQYYSQWFYPYPWQELKLSEFPDLARYAQGFPTNITFSEGIGFLAKDDPRSNVAFAIVAHEAAHQWWGNILTPGKGPGGNVVAEGLAHCSAALLIEQIRGPLRAMEFRKRIEESYSDRRRADAERPLVEVDGSKVGDTTVTYDKGGWVFWMLIDTMGRDRAFAGLSELIRLDKDGPDFPLLQDVIATLRTYAEDQAGFDAFVDQWVLGVEVPEYRFSAVDVATIQEGGLQVWEVTASLRNDGTATAEVEVAVTNGERMDEEGDALPDYRDARTTVTLGPGQEQELRIRCDFKPNRILPDPDVRILQLNRDKAMRRL
jgi:ABC-2 type transport system permease protein